MRGLPGDSNNVHPVDRLTKITMYFLWENMGLARNVCILGRAGAGRGGFASPLKLLVKREAGL